MYMEYFIYLTNLFWTMKFMFRIGMNDWVHPHWMEISWVQSDVSQSILYGTAKGKTVYGRQRNSIFHLNKYIFFFWFGWFFHLVAFEKKNYIGVVCLKQIRNTFFLLSKIYWNFAFQKFIISSCHICGKNKF